MLRRNVAPVLMRFGPKNGQATSGASKATGNGQIRFKDIPDSMKPVELSDTYTSFPLPTYDPNIKYGPTRLDNIPELAQKEKEEAEREQLRRVSTMMLDEESEEPLELTHQMETAGELQSPQAQVEVELVERKKSIPSYVRDDSLGPVVDRLRCTLSPKELLARFDTELEILHRRTAVLNDITSTIDNWTNEELMELYERLGKVFRIGRPMLFVSGYKEECFAVMPIIATEYYIPMCELIQAIESAVLQQPERFLSQPDFAARTIFMIGHLQVTDKVGAFSPNPHRPRAIQQLRPFGQGNTLPYQNYAESAIQLVGDMFTEEWTAEYRLKWSQDTIAELFGAICSAAPLDGFVGNPVVRAALDLFFENGKRFGTSESAVARMVLSCSLCEINDRRLVELCYDCIESLTSNPRGGAAGDLLSIDMLVGLARLRPIRPLPLVKLYHFLRSRVAELPPILDSEEVTRLVETLPSRQFQAIMQEQLRASVPLSFAEAVKAFRKPKDESKLKNTAQLFDALESPCCGNNYGQDGVTTSERIDGGASHVLPSAQRTCEWKSQTLDPLAVCQRYNLDVELLQGIKLDALGEMLTTGGEFRCNVFSDSHTRVRSWNTAYILHSSALNDYTDNITQLLHTLESGRSGILVTTQTLLAMYQRATTSPDLDVRRTNREGLRMLVEEAVQPDQNIVVLPLSSEIEIVGNGDWYEEDALMWVLGNHLLRHFPAVHPCIIVDPKDKAAKPHFCFRQDDNGLVARMTTDYGLITGTGHAKRYSPLGVERPGGASTTRLEDLNEKIQLKIFGRYCQGPRWRRTWRRSYGWQLAYQKDFNRRDKKFSIGDSVREGHARLSGMDFTGLGVHVGPSAAGAQAPQAGLDDFQVV